MSFSVQHRFVRVYRREEILLRADHDAIVAVP